MIFISAKTEIQHPIWNFKEKEGLKNLVWSSSEAHLGYQGDKQQLRGLGEGGMGVFWSYTLTLSLPRMYIYILQNVTQQPRMFIYILKRVAWLAVRSFKIEWINLIWLLRRVWH